MAGVMPYERESLAEFNLTPAIHSLEELSTLEQLGRPIDFHLKIDSGMGRLGTRAKPTEIVGAVRAVRHSRLEGIMTHFASAADFTSQQTEQQIAHFEGV